MASASHGKICIGSVLKLMHSSMVVACDCLSFNGTYCASGAVVAPQRASRLKENSFGYGCVRLILIVAVEAK